MTNADWTVYLDLDRTLFRTDDFMTELWARIAEIYNDASYKAQSQQLESHYQQQNDGNRLYDLSMHARSIGIDPDMLYPRLITSTLNRSEWLYPGARELVEWLDERVPLRILTYGANDFQQLKISLCSALDGVPVTIVQSDKSEWLRHVGAKGVLVDDRPVAVPPQMRLIQINHHSQSDGGEIASSLYEVKHRLEQIIDK